jgi:hypothetical protein
VTGAASIRAGTAFYCNGTYDPDVFSATAGELAQNTTRGVFISGFGTTNDVSLINRQGVTALGVTANTNNIAISGNLTVSGTGTSSFGGAVSAATGAAVGGATAGAGGIAFPATAVAVANVNTLDDYEEGTWTPNQGSGLTVVGAFSSSGIYTKIGNTVFVKGVVSGATSIAITAGSICTGNLPFAASTQCTLTLVNQNFDAGSFGACNSSDVWSAGAIAATGSIRFSFTYTV